MGQAGELELHPVGIGEVFETEEFSDKLCSKGPRPSTARQPSQGAECRALGIPEAAWHFQLQVWVWMLTERHSEPRTNTADGARGALIVCRQHPRTQKKTQDAGACWELRVRAGVRVATFPCAREVSLLQIQVP